IEICNPDMARKPLPFGLGERGNGFAERDLRVWPMHEQEIDEVDAESLQALSTERAKSPARRYSCDTLVVGKISSRRTPEARMPSPTPRSVPYFQAVSIWR